MISLGVPERTGEKPGSTRERGRQAWEHLGALATSLGAPRRTVELPESTHIFFGNAAGAPGNHLTEKTQLLAVVERLYKTHAFSSQK